MFERYLASWRLEKDGAPIVTPSSHLLPVRFEGAAAMLKVATDPDERLGARLMVWWGGDGAARVFAHDGAALLLDRATGHRSLIEMSRVGRDDEASQILCAVADRLHSPRRRPPPDLLPLERWFDALWPAAVTHGGVLAESAAAARELLGEPRDVTPLHGDLHHGNVLDFGARGWLAIDPKRIVGERGFDFANVFCNPDLETSTRSGRLARQADVVAKAAQLDRPRLVKWILAYAGLSAAWTLNDEKDEKEARQALAVAAIAAAELSR